MLTRCHLSHVLLLAALFLLHGAANGLRCAGTTSGVKLRPHIPLFFNRDSQFSVTENDSILKKEDATVVKEMIDNRSIVDDDIYSDTIGSNDTVSMEIVSNLLPPDLSTENITLSFAQIRPFLDIGKSRTPIATPTHKYCTYHFYLTSCSDPFFQRRQNRPQ